MGFNIWPTPFIIFVWSGWLLFIIRFHYYFFDVVYQLTLIIIHKQQNQSGHLVTTLNPTRIYFFSIKIKFEVDLNILVFAYIVLYVDTNIS